MARRSHPLSTPGRRRIAAGLATLLATAGLLLVPAVGPGAAATAGSLAVRPAVSFTGELVRFDGAVPPRAPRPVVLQRRTDSGWVRVKATTTDRRGRFVIRVPAATEQAVTDYRVRAPATQIRGEQVKAVTTPVRQVTTVDPMQRITDGDGISRGPALSADGRYVAFSSDAGNLTPADNNGVEDVFLADRFTGVVTMVSGADGRSYAPAVSDDGRYVAFASEAAALDPDGVVHGANVHVWDRSTGEITCTIGGDATTDSPDISDDGRVVAVASAASELAGTDANGDQEIVVVSDCADVERITTGDASSLRPTLSADGRHVAFQSAATDLAPTSGNGLSGVFVHDRADGVTARIGAPDANALSPAISGDGHHVVFFTGSRLLVPGDDHPGEDVYVWTPGTSVVRVTDGTGSSVGPSISADGSRVSFSSSAGDLVDGDTNGRTDQFLWDRDSRALSRVAAGNGGVGTSRISADGQHVAFSSSSSDLTAGDTNGVTDVFVRNLVP